MVSGARRRGVGGKDVSDRLQGRVALVSGAARGLGKADSTALAREGARVVMGDILADECAAAAAQLAEQGLDVEHVVLDVTQPASWNAAVARTEERFGHLDVLVNNAGIIAGRSVENLTEDEWNRVLGVNASGVAFGMRAALPALKRAGGGSIINMSSTMALWGVPGYFAYTASKGAISAMSRAAAVEYGPVGIRVNVICPGLIATPMTDDDPEALKQAHVDATPVRRVGQPEDIAYGVVYLASDESSFVTGIELVIDGGHIAQ